MTMNERAKGPVELLCKEIDYHFDRHMETTGIYVSFVSVLVSHVADIRGWQDRIATIPGVIADAPSNDSAEALRRTEEMLGALGREALIRQAAEVHGFIHAVEGSEDGPCDHLIDMLSSCVSAIRFGLEVPCRSRHAAEAAGHIWRLKYGVKLEDDCTPAWKKDWARRQLQTAILRLALALTTEGVTVE